MSKHIYTYALIKTLHDEGKDYIDSFWPFAVKVFPTDKTFLGLNAVQSRIKENFTLEIPFHSLRTILKRAKKKNHIEQKNGGYRLTQNGLKYLDAFETDKDVDRRLNSLINDIKQFLSEHGISSSIDQIHDNFFNFLHKHINPIIECFSPVGVSNHPVIPKATIFEKLLIEFVATADKEKPEHYKTLQDIVFGSIISTIFSSENPFEIDRKFKHCQVFLDSNYIFSVLDLDSPEFNNPAKELFQLLKKYRFKVKVFSFTVDEICRVINGYLREGHRYPTTMKVDSIYSIFKRKNWTKSVAREFITNIAETLSNSGIAIEWVKNIDVKNYSPTDDKLRSIITRCKPWQLSLSQNHDLAALERIKELREKPIRKLEACKAFFLTSDKALNRCNFVEMGHNENGTVCEVILDSLLTNILWLKNPNLKVSLKSIIGAYSRDLFIKRRIWERFYETLRELKQKDKVKDGAITTLFYNNYIEDVLIGFDETEATKITQEFVLEEIEKASKLTVEDIERKQKEKEEEFLRHLDQEVSKKEQEKDEEWFRKLQEIKEKIKGRAEKLSNRRSNVYASIFSLLLVVIIYDIYLILNNYLESGFLPILFYVLLGGGGISEIWIRLRSNLKNRLLNSIYIQKLKEIGLHETKEKIQ